MKSSAEYRQDYAAAADGMKALVATCETEDREFTSDEQDRFDELRAECDELNSNIESAERRETCRDSATDADESAGGQSFRTSDGQILRSFRYGEQLAAERRDSFGHSLAVGETIYGMLTGNVDERAQTVGSQTAGGYLVNDAVSREIIDLARSASVTMRAGAQTLPISGTTRIVRVASDPTAYWRGETAPITASDMTFDAIELQPKVVGVIVPISIELFEDAAGAAQQIESVLGAVMGLALDQAVLTGAGSGNEPMGIQNHSSVNAQASIGTPSDYTDITSAVQTILTANYPGEVSSLAWVAHPRDWGTYQGLVTGISSDVTPLAPPEWASQLRRLSTTSIPTTLGGGSNESIMQIGDFSQIVVGMRTNVTLSVHESGQVTDDASETWNATTQLMRFIRVYMRLDVGILRPNWFVNLTGVTA